MSSPAVSAVWKYARAKGSDLLTLLYLAECAQMDGRDAFPSAAAIAEGTRLTVRGVRYILHRLEGAGEIVIHHNTDGRTLTTSKGKVFRPVWFIDVRCLADQERYCGAAEQEKFASPAFPGGRRQQEKIAGSVARANRKTLPANGNGDSAQWERERTPDPGPNDTYPPHAQGLPRPTAEVDPSRDPSRELRAGADAPPAADSAGASRRSIAPDTPDQNLGVITKLAHEVLDLFAGVPDLRVSEITEAIKRRCALYHVAYDSDVVTKALDSACYQRQRAGKPSVLAGSAGEAAFRLQGGSG